MSLQFPVTVSVHMARRSCVGVSFAGAEGWFHVCVVVVSSELLWIDGLLSL